jgi:hypothetical protein
MVSYRSCTRTATIIKRSSRASRKAVDYLCCHLPYIMLGLAAGMMVLAPAVYAATYGKSLWELTLGSILTKFGIYYDTRNRSMHLSVGRYTRFGRIRHLLCEPSRSARDNHSGHQRSGCLERKRYLPECSGNGDYHRSPPSKEDSPYPGRSLPDESRRLLRELC